MILYYKDPDASKDYGWDWGTDYLQGDTIADSEWFADSADLTLQDDTFDDTTTTVWIAEGILGATYLVTNRITTDGGRIDDRSFRIKINQQ